MRLFAATRLPAEVDAKNIAEEAMQTAFRVIADRLEAEGYPVSGDFAPDEAVTIDNAFVSFVHAMALNNPVIAELNRDEDEDGVD